MRNASGLSRALRATLVAGLAAVTIGCGPPSPPGLGPASRSVAPLVSFPIGSPPVYLAIAPDGSRVYAASTDRLSIIGVATGSILHTVETPPMPTGLAVTPDGSRVLMTTLFGLRLAVIDGTSGSITSHIRLVLEQIRGGYGRIAVTPDGATAYVANQDNLELGVVDLRAGTSQNTSLDMRPTDVAVAPDGRRLYIVGCRNFCVTGTIEVMEVPSGTFASGRMSVGGQPYRIALSPDGARAYTANVGDSTLSVVDLTTGALIAKVPVGAQPTSIAVTRDGRLVYVASQAGGSLTVVDTATSSVRASVPIRLPREVVVTPDGSRVYVSSRESVLVLDARTLIGGS